MLAGQQDMKKEVKNINTLPLIFLPITYLAIG
jgi:hypothetical protein